MKNKIIYGSVGTGKTRMFFTPIIEEFKGYVIAIPGENLSESYFNDLSKFNVQDLAEIKNIFDDTKEEKFIGTISNSKDFYWYNKELKDILGAIDRLKLDKPVLIAIDEFVMFDLTKESDDKSDDKSIFLKLLENERIQVVICIQTLDVLRQKYKNEYGAILKHCELISTKEFLDYSGELRLRLPKSLHKILSIKAEQEGTSLNQYICYLIASNNHLSELSGMAFETIQKQIMINETLYKGDMLVIDPQGEYEQIIKTLKVNGYKCKRIKLNEFRSGTFNPNTDMEHS